MAPTDVRRLYKRPAISDQQKRREQALLRQQKSRRDSQNHARFIANSVFSLPDQSSDNQIESVFEEEQKIETEASTEISDFNVIQASKLQGSEARKWFAKQIMLPEWMIDVPPRLNTDWYVFPRPAGKRCLVVSSNGTTVSRVRNGSILHRFPSALPNGARTKSNCGSSSIYCILDCIFHEPDQTYYVIDMVCWRGHSFYDCDVEFRFSWLNSKLSETEACNPPSFYHRYRFCTVPIYDSDQEGIRAAYTSPVQYTKDGLLFYNKYAHYQTGSTPLALIWKDDRCSQYVIDTDNKGQVPSKQQVILELQADGKLCTSDDPPVIFGWLDKEFQTKSGLEPEKLVRFAIGDGGLKIVDGALEMADMQYIGKSNRARAFADSYSKVLFQYNARHSPLKFEELLASIHSSNNQDTGPMDVEMVD